MRGIRGAVLLVSSALISLLAGCDAFTNMTRADVIAAVEECRDAGLEPEILRNGLNWSIRDVQCVIPRDR